MTGVPGVQVPIALQISLPLQALPSAQDVPTVTGVCAMPVTGSQLSVVHGLPSSIEGGVPARQVPEALQVSAPLQTLASAQDVPAETGVCLTPVTGSQLSAVQGLLSLTDRGVPAMQVPAALQVSLPLQTLASAQDVPVATGVCLTPGTGSQLSAVQGLPSLVATGVPGAQVPLWQVSVCVQTLLSVQLLPFVLGEQMPTRPARLHEEHWSVQAVLQQTPLTQLPEAHWVPVVQVLPPVTS